MQRLTNDMNHLKCNLWPQLEGFLKSQSIRDFLGSFFHSRPRATVVLQAKNIEGEGSYKLKGL